MKAEAMSLTFLSNEGLVKIPFFQRGYVWNIDNWEDILTDLLDSNKSHFLGSLILKQLEKQTGKSNQVLVIDGQQRLTTLSVLLKALYNSFDDEIKKNCLSSIQTHLFFKKNQTDRDLLVKIEHSKIDKKHFTKVIKDEISQSEYDSIIVENPILKVTSKSNKIFQCFKFFTETLKNISVEKREELFNRLLEKDNKILVVIDLSDKEDEQAIFDTINSAGVRLSSADIIKNAVFQKALDLFDDENGVEEVETLYTEHWENIFSLDEDSINFWETPRVTGRLMRDNIEILLHSISVIKGFFDPDRHTLSDLSTLYKEYIIKLDKVELVAFIKEISKYARLFREKILVFDDTSLFKYDDDHSRLFHILNICEISTFHPYILSLLYKYSEDESSLKKELKNLESLIVRRMITRAETKSYNKMCKDFIKDETVVSSKLSEQTNDEVLNGLGSISNKNAKLLLFWIELYRRQNDNKQSMKELKYNYSLEHVLPQRWEEYWSGIDVLDSNMTIIQEPEKAKSIRYSKVYSIGNMTLLNSSLNTSLRNYEFKRKIEGEGRKRGIRAYADLGITRFDILEPYEQGDEIWNEAKIEARTSALFRDIVTIWK